MIIYRPHRGSLKDSMDEAKEFTSELEMKKYIINQYSKGTINIEDIVIDDGNINDDRIGWKDSKHICVKRFSNEDFMKEYGISQCIGICATDYKRP